MSTKLLIPNSFQTPNLIVDDLLPYLKSTELKVLLLLIRKTFGWGKEEDRISLSQFMQGTGAGRANIVEALKQLKECNIVLKSESTKGDTYWLNREWSYEDNTEWFQNRTSFKMELVSKRNQSGSKMKPQSGSKMKRTETNIKPTILNQYILSNNCPNCKSKIRVKKKKANSKYENTIYCDKCHCEFVLNENSSIEYLNNGTDYEAMECYNKYFELHPNSEDMIYEKPVALKMFQNILKRCKNSGANGEAKEIVFERLENYFNNEFYEKVNWSIETFSKNFNTFTTKHQVTTTSLPYFN